MTGADPAAPPVPLREGFTTGTAAAAAARAAVRLLLALARDPEAVLPSPLPLEDTPLPGGGRLLVPLARLEIEPGPRAQTIRVRAVVVKDGGDDPDATHGAEIHVLAEVMPGPSGLPASSGPPGNLEILGGLGVGRVTLPGLPVPPGHPAINPAPMAQIRAAVAEIIAEKVAEAAARSGPASESAPAPGLRLTIEVPDGLAISRKTMNERLGILGGISILGTAGIVKPFSHDAWLASVTQALAIARASGLTQAVLTTGRRSERFFSAAFPDTPALGLIQAADFFSASMQAAARLGFTRVVWSLFFGKLVKQAQGFASTHAASARIDFSRLAVDCLAAGLPPQVAEAAATANTAMEVQTLAAPWPQAQALYRRLARTAMAQARAFAQEAADAPLPGGLGVALFDFDGALLLFEEE